MRIGFNARLLHDPGMRGWNRYAHNLIRELALLGHSLALYTDQPLHRRYLDELPTPGGPGGDWTVRAPSRPLNYFAWEQAWLPRECARDRVDVLHSPVHFGLPWFSNCARVLTLHDAIDPIYYRPAMPWRERASRLHFKVLLQEGIARRSADRFVTVSEFSRRDLERALGIPRERISVTWEAAEPFFGEGTPEANRAARAPFGLDRPYFFYVGGWEKRKNLPLLLRAFAAAKFGDACELALAGGGSPDVRAPLEALAGELGIADRLRLLPKVSEAELRGLYAGALAFVYPSEYEGFGLQLCEAMAVGCPVLAADASCLPEILGEGGAKFPLGDPAGLASLLARVAREPAYRDELAAHARRRGKDFSWRRTAEQTVEAYRLAIAAHATRMRRLARG